MKAGKFLVEEKQEQERADGKVKPYNGPETLDVHVDNLDVTDQVVAGIEGLRVNRGIAATAVRIRPEATIPEGDSVHVVQENAHIPEVPKFQPHDRHLRSNEQHAHKMHSYRPSSFARSSGDCRRSRPPAGVEFCRYGFMRWYCL